MSEYAGFRVELFKEAVIWAEKVDDHGSKITIRLDDKSQQTGTVAGVFLASGLSFLKADSLSGFTHHQKILAGVLLFVGVCSLVCCVVMCLSVTWLRTSPLPLTLEVLLGVAEDVASHSEDELDDQVKMNIYRDRLRVWEQVFTERQKLNKNKGKFLKLAQTLLVNGILSVACLLFLIIWSIFSAKS